MFKGNHFPRHVHYGHEQIVYVIEGSGIYIINGKIQHCSKGMLFHMPSDSVHETFNTGPHSLRELFISAPTRYDLEFSSFKMMKACKKSDMLVSAIEVLELPLLAQTTVPFTIFDGDGNIISQNGRYLPFCTETCQPASASSTCACMSLPQFEEASGSATKQFTCAYGLTTYYVPIVVNGLYLGCIAGGHFRSSASESCAVEELYALPDSTKKSIQQRLEKMSESIVSFCEFYSIYQSLHDKDAQIQQAEIKKSMLEQNLHFTKKMVTSLRMDYHFLFNTLNTIASMSLESDREDTYDAITKLSKMLRYIMSTNQDIVKLEEEIHYLNLYLDMQKLRFGDKLCVEYEIDEALHCVRIPFNFLQPIVENAFVHGSSRNRHCQHIRINVSNSDGRLLFRIWNDGQSLNPGELERVRNHVVARSGHGLSLIYEKLQNLYGNDFSFHIDNADHHGVLVQISIPDKEGGQLT
ncbi:MAG TPA: histidine kinase [Bacillota bacterium]|jgi:ligand-binding sensor protein|nr:histidine kinase [Bacillota bacterium]HQB81601.1 histidine kinase [Bacillota bacterium]